MAEYKLSYTAQEIDSKLGKISEIENSLYDKQDKLTFDLEPVEDGENPITSGGVYAALQSVAGNVESVNGKMGAVELTAEDVGALPNTTQIPTVPMNVSEFSNDAGYITSEALENKQDKLTFDAEPAEGSENPITSGGVYNALQNVGGGSTNLIAGDGIEIKDGVIRSTLGDIIGTVNTFNELCRIDNLMLEGEDGEYYWEGLVDNVPEFGETVSVYLTLPGEDTPIHYSSEVVDFDGDGYARYVFCNIDPNEFVAIDPSLPFFGIVFVDDVDEGIKYANMIAFGDYTGSTVVVGTGGVETKYATLPDNALKAGKFIEIKDGQIRLTLGDKIVTEKSVSILDEEIYSMTKHETIDNLYSSEQFTGNNVPVLETRVNIELTLADSDQPIVYENIEVDEYGANDEWGKYYDYTCMVANTDQWCGNIVNNNGFASKDDDTIPALMIRGYIDDDKGYYRVYVYSSEDLSGATIKVTNNYTQTDYVKLPKGALGFGVDEEPERGSSNLVTSGGVYDYIKSATPNLYYDNVPTQYSSNLVTSGVIYNALQDVKPNLSYDSAPTAGSNNLVTSGNIYTAIQNATPNLTYDETPTEGSGNLVTSGTIYTAIQNAIGDVDSVLAEINSRIGGAS